MVKPLIDERRESIRARRILSIQFRMVKSSLRDSDKSWHLSMTNDMSVSGLSFLSEVPYHMDDTLELHVVMSGVLDIFKGYGKVVRVEKKESAAFYLIAVRFIENKRVTHRKAGAAPGVRIHRLKKSSDK
ncbi:MAG: PilZ domain-containing protein [Candidatus Omnitrophota bacterium]|nr:PilZ domain-containing protein [Candidatus Omnitrophota bacterium]MDZ4242271.1 PilZ domain-containing protein [Candidatus Omnitrophota bacterium]